MIKDTLGYMVVLGLTSSALYLPYRLFTASTKAETMLLLLGLACLGVFLWGFSHFANLWRKK